MRILEINQKKELEGLMRKIKVDPYGIKIMLSKGTNRLIKINSISNIAANILKQEMLSFGAEAAISRGALTGKSKKTDCLLMGNLSQINRLTNKLQKQPFGLNKLADEISSSINNYDRGISSLALGGRRIDFGKKTCIMGIVNLTPDSFSNDGLYQEKRACRDYSFIVDYVQKMIWEGAGIIDVGGESSRPQAAKVSLKEEIRRVIPVIKILAKKIKVPISVDTSKPEVAKLALENGADIINDITGLKDPLMAKVCSRYKSGLVIMHMKGNPRTMQINPQYKDLIQEIITFLRNALEKASKAGIDLNKIIIDPGIGFGKTLSHNLEILKNLKEFKILGRPIMVGVSRKSFIGKIIDKDAGERLYGSLSSCIIAAQNGAKILRVHDVKAVSEALKIFDAVNLR